MSTEKAMSITSLRLFLLSLLTLGSLCCSQKTPGDAKHPRSLEELKTQLEDTLKENKIPGLSVAIVDKNQEEVFGLGLADVESKRPLTKDTLVRIGSVSKGFVALAILKLVQQGELSLQDTLAARAPEVWFKNDWEATHPIRIVHLLEHTTGWDDMHLREYAAPEQYTDILKKAFDFDHRSRISRWQPGTRMAYCNSGPAAAAFIVEKITNMKFEDYVTTTFLKPLGMLSATYFVPAKERTTNLYHHDGTTIFPYWHLLYRPSGAMNASAQDMAAYLRFYLNRGTVNGETILDAQAIDRMETPTSTWV